MSVTAAEVRRWLLERLADPLAACGLSPELVPEDFDLLSEGVIDSLGMLELITGLEEDLGLAVDFEELDADHLTIVGPFCRFVAEHAGGGGGGAA